MSRHKPNIFTAVRLIESSRKYRNRAWLLMPYDIVLIFSRLIGSLEQENYTILETKVRLPIGASFLCKIELGCWENEGFPPL